MNDPVSRETQLQQRAEAMAYARLDEKRMRVFERHFRRKVRIVDFILAWRDGESCADIAAGFGLSDPDYVSRLRARLGLSSRGHGGPRAKNKAVTSEFLAHFAPAGAASRPGAAQSRDRSGRSVLPALGAPERRDDGGIGAVGASNPGEGA